MEALFKQHLKCHVLFVRFIYIDGGFHGLNFLSTVGLSPVSLKQCWLGVFNLLLFPNLRPVMQARTHPAFCLITCNVVR